MSDSTPASIVRNQLDILTEIELATALGHKSRDGSPSTSTLQVWRSEGYGPDYVKLGKTVFYRRCDVICWIDCSVHPATKQGNTTQ